MSKRKRKTDEILFEKTMELLDQDKGEYGHMGDFITMKSLLLMTVHRAFTAHTRPNPHQEVNRTVIRLAYSLIGTGVPEHPVPIVGFHAPGISDVFFTENLGVKGETPLNTAEQAVLAMLDDFRKLEESADKSGLTEEDWGNDAERLIDKYTLLFMGRPNNI